MMTKNAPAFAFHPERGTRIGLHPRYAKSDDATRWFDFESLWIWHVANAWQEGDRVRIFACIADEVLSVFI